MVSFIRNSAWGVDDSSLYPYWRWWLSLILGHLSRMNWNNAYTSIVIERIYSFFIWFYKRKSCWFRKTFWSTLWFEDGVVEVGHPYWKLFVFFIYHVFTNHKKGSADLFPFRSEIVAFVSSTDIMISFGVSVGIMWGSLSLSIKGLFQ